MNIAGADLNLLVVFDALIVEQNVTRAGQRIGLSQPATSSALLRLRRLFGDELFVKTSTGMQPTLRALRLAALIRPALSQLQMALDSQECFEPSTSKHLFRLGMSDYAEFVFLPVLMGCLSRIAPQVQVQIKGTDRQDALQLLDHGEIDLAVGFYPRCSTWHKQQTLFEEEFVCVCRRGHPTVREPLTVESYLATQHLLVSLKEDFIGRIDLQLARSDLRRHIALSVPHFLAALHVLAHTDLIAALPARVARVHAESLGLQTLPLPLSVSGFTVSMVWHSRQTGEPGHDWLRSQLTAACRLKEPAS